MLAALRRNNACANCAQRPARAAPVKDFTKARTRPAPKSEGRRTRWSTAVKNLERRISNLKSQFGEAGSHFAFTLGMPPRVAPLTLLCLFVFAAHAPARVPVGKELKKAEAVLSKLRRLEEAADRGSFAKAARKLYPGLYAKVSGLREGDLKTDLSTAVALYESALRAGPEGDGGAPDCAREMREAYARLCRGASGRAGLLRAKARLHARWAEAAIVYARGERGAEVLDALHAVRAERSTDRALAEEALHVLEGLTTEAGGANADADCLEQLDRILASLPRDHARRLLREARDAFRDGLYWRLKAAPARSSWTRTPSPRPAYSRASAYAPTTPTRPRARTSAPHSSSSEKRKKRSERCRNDEVRTPNDELKDRCLQFIVRRSDFIVSKRGVRGGSSP